MVNGMATRKVTITLDEHEIARIKELVSSGSVKSVSSFVQRAVSSSLDADAIWTQTLADLLDETGGPLTAAEQRRADQILTSDQPAQ